MLSIRRIRDLRWRSLERHDMSRSERFEAFRAS
jgi:hypothetical protein